MPRFWIVLAAIALTGAVLVAAPDSGSAAEKGDSYGLVDPATGIWHLYEGGTEVGYFYFGNPGDYPFVGDWNCNDIDTPGLYRQSDGYVYLRNSNSQGNANISFYFGNPGDVPIAGDFNADGCDTVSIYRPSNQTFYIINKLGTNDGGLGAADYSYVFGNPGDKPFIGDFNGSGQDTAGLHRESTGLVYYRNTNTQGNADNTFIYGDPGDRFVAGDWTNNGIDSPGVFRPWNRTMYLRYENSQGNADESWQVGYGTWLPVSGRFGDNLPAPPTTTTTTTTKPPTPTRDIAWSCTWDDFLSKYDCSGNVNTSDPAHESWTCSWKPDGADNDDWDCTGHLYPSVATPTRWYESSFRSPVISPFTSLNFGGQLDEQVPTYYVPWQCYSPDAISSYGCSGDIDTLDRVDESWVCQLASGAGTKSCSGQVDKSTTAVEEWSCTWSASLARWDCVGDSMREVMLMPIGRPPGLW